MKESETVAALSALAHETRLRVFRALVGAGPAGLPAGALSTHLRLSPPNLSFHLAHLRHAGLIEARRQGRSIIYIANFTAINRLLGYLTDHCCGGRPELCIEPVSDRARAASSSRTVRRPLSRGQRRLPA